MIPSKFIIRSARSPLKNSLRYASTSREIVSRLGDVPVETQQSTQPLIEALGAAYYPGNWPAYEMYGLNAIGLPWWSTAIAVGATFAVANHLFGANKRFLLGRDIILKNQDTYAVFLKINEKMKLKLMDTKSPKDVSRVIKLQQKFTSLDLNRHASITFTSLIAHIMPLALMNSSSGFFSAPGVDFGSVGMLGQLGAIDHTHLILPALLYLNLVVSERLSIMKLTPNATFGTAAKWVIGGILAGIYVFPSNVAFTMMLSVYCAGDAISSRVSFVKLLRAKKVSEEIPRMKIAGGFLKPPTALESLKTAWLAVSK